MLLQLVGGWWLVKEAVGVEVAIELVEEIAMDLVAFDMIDGCRHFDGGGCDGWDAGGYGGGVVNGDGGRVGWEMVVEMLRVEMVVLSGARH